ncbi:MAG: nucleoside 2-deoxyribosyltransferase domain-containing protein [Minisyncoccia bacterium]
MNYIEALNEYEGDEISIFFAGGITNCSDWQKELADKLKDLPITILNPRRKNFSTLSLEGEEEQIKWEFNHMRRASAISFWFSKETLNPITLLELGSQLSLNKKLFIGIDPDYQKKDNVIIQTKLARPQIEIVYSLDDLASQIKNWGK